MSNHCNTRPIVLESISRYGDISAISFTAAFDLLIKKNPILWSCKFQQMVQFCLQFSLADLQREKKANFASMFVTCFYTCAITVQCVLFSGCLLQFWCCLVQSMRQMYLLGQPLVRTETTSFYFTVFQEVKLVYNESKRKLNITVSNKFPFKTDPSRETKK